MSLRKITSYVLIIILAIYSNTASILVYALSPNDISNKVFFLDAQDTDNDGNSANEPANNSQITNLIDKFNSNTGTQIISGQKPLYKINSINLYPSLSFDGTDDLLNLNDNLDISLDTSFSEKSYVMIIKTGNDVNTFQTIYDEGTKEKGFSFQVDNGHIYAGAYNSIDWGNTNRIIDLGLVNPNEIYTIIFVYSNSGNFIKAYLNGTLINTLNTTELQTTHGACTFETSFNCNMYLTGGTLALGSTKNDTLLLSNNTQIVDFEGNFFKGNIGEISSYNYALTQAEVDGLNDYLFLKWGFDTTAPVINSTNISSGSILPGGNHNIIFNYTDSGTGSTGVDTTSGNMIFERWDGTNWIVNTNISNTNTTISQSTYTTNNLNYGKYKITFNISDNAGNTSLNSEIIFYIDKPELIISTGSINIGELNDSINNFGDTLIITVKTIGASFKVKLKKNQNLELNTGEFIPYYDGTTGMGYDKNNDGTVFDFNDDIVGQEVLNINTDGNLNTYTYAVKIGAIVEYQQAGGDYSGKIDFGIELDY